MRQSTILLAAVVLCVGCSDDPDVSEPATVTKTAEKRQDPAKSVEALIADLASDVPSVRVEAADALSKVGPEAHAAVPALVEQLEHKAPSVRVAAMETLGEMGAPAVPELIRAFQTGSGAVPIRSCLVLAAMGPEAKEAIPVLSAALDDESNAFRDRIPGFIARIEADPSPQAEAPVAPGDGQPKPVGAVLPNVAPGGSPDWPGFHGPRRDSICTETGLLQEWPDGGPKLLWTIEGLGAGLSGVSIADGKIFTMSDRQPDGRQPSQFAVAFDLESREELWATRVGPAYDHGDGGPRCTPTVDGQLLYVLGTDGDLLCLSTETGDVQWQQNLVVEFGGRLMTMWKFCESPLIDGPRLVCTPGGEEAAMVALDKKTGEPIWTCAMPELGAGGRDGAAYASMVVAEIQGVRQYVQMLGRGVVGVDAQTGKFLWGYNRIANGVANITAPIVRDSNVFVTTAYRTGCALLEIVRSGDEFEPREVYFLDARQFSNHHGGVVLVGDYLYAGDGFNKGNPICLDFATGEILWKHRPPGPGSAALLYADGHLIFRYDRGPIYLVEATPKAFRIKGTFTPPVGEGPAWPHPVIHDGRLYLRHSDLLMCYDLKP